MPPPATLDAWQRLDAFGRPDSCLYLRLWTRGRDWTRFATFSAKPTRVEQLPANVSSRVHFSHRARSELIFKEGAPFTMKSDPDTNAAAFAVLEASRAQRLGELPG